MGLNLKIGRPCRLDDDLYLKTKYLAKLENRSFNNYVEKLLIEVVNDYEKKNGPIIVDTDELYK